MNIASKNIDFGLALCAAKRGQRIARAGWNGKGMFVFQRPGDELPVTVLPNVKSLPVSVKNFLTEKYGSETHYAGGEAITVSFGAYLCMYAADGSIVNGWLASQSDMQATDWMVLEEPAG